MTSVDRYLVHGLDLRVGCDDPEARGTIARRLGPYSVTDATAPVGAPASIVIGQFGSLLKDAEPGRPVYSSPIARVTYHDDTDLLTVDGDAVHVRADLGAGSVRMSVLRDDGEAWALAAYPFLSLVLMELMKVRGRYALHAGGVAVEGQGILIPGTSGAGKSTLTAALLRAGAGFLSDDIVYLQPDSPRISVFPFADELDVSDATAAMFAELEHLVGTPTPVGRPKHAVRAEEQFGSERVDHAWATALIMPTIVPGPASSLVEADPTELLAQLVPDVLLTDPTRSQLHVDALGALVDQVPAYRLAAGGDVRAAAELVLSTLG